MNEIQRSIIDAIKVQVNEKIKNLQFDKTCYGKVVTIRDNICDVEINGEITQCKIRNGLQINVNDIVLVRLINNDFSNKFVDAKLGTVGDDVEVEVDWSDIIGKPSSSPSDIDDSVSKKHTHNNLSLLETITQTLVNAWNSAVSHISDTIRHITSNERNLWNTVSNKIDNTEVVTTATPNKILKLDSNSKLPTSITGNADGNASTATKLQTARNISLSGDVIGSANFDGSSNITINATVVDDSHNHIISNVDGLQAALDGKSDIAHNHNLANLAERNYTSLVGRPADDDFHMLTELLDSANDDELVIYDVSDSSYKKITRENLLAGLLSGSQFVFIRKKEEFTATEGQTVFNLTQGSYEVGTGRVDVYIWGNKQPPSAYTETSSTSITLVNGVEAGTKVLIEYIQIANVMDYIHAQNHKIGGIDPISPADIGAANEVHTHSISDITNLQTTLDAKAPLASPNFTGVPTAPTAPNGTNTDQIATTKFVQNALSAGGYGDMLKSQYDTDGDGIVDRAETADKLTTARTISLSGDVVGSTIFDGSADISINTTRLIKNNSFILDSLYTFTRSSTAYLSDGTLVNMNLPRFEPGRFGKAILVEEGTTNILPSNDATGKTLFPSNNNVYSVNSLVSDFGRSDNYSIKSTQVQSGFNYGFYTPRYNISPDVEYSASLYVYTSLSGKAFRVGINWADSNNNTISNILSDSIDIVPGKWTRLMISGKSPINAAKALIVCHALSTSAISEVGDIYYFDDFLFEAKPYPTSFTDGTRTAETLTIPTERVLNPQEGTIECWVYNSLLFSSKTGVIFDVKGANGDRMYLEIGINHQLKAVTYISGQVFSAVSSPLTLGWHYIATTWDSNSIICYVDGKMAATRQSPQLLDTAVLATIGSTTASSYHLNSFIDDLRISNRARTDAEILAAYQSNEPLPYDAYTTWLSRFDNNYGLIGNSSNQIPVSNGILCTNLNAERTNGIKITASTIAPTSPQINDIWIDLN